MAGQNGKKYRAEDSMVDVLHVAMCWAQFSLVRIQSGVGLVEALLSAPSASYSFLLPLLLWKGHE